MDSKELTEWQAFSTIEPFGEERQDLRSAMIACTIANANRGPKTPAYKLEAFMLKFEPPKQQSTDDMKAMLGI